MASLKFVLQKKSTTRFYSGNFRALLNIGHKTSSNSTQRDSFFTLSLISDVCFFMIHICHALSSVDSFDWISYCQLENDLFGDWIEEECWVTSTPVSRIDNSD